MKNPFEMKPGNRYGRERGAGTTLGELAAAKMALVAVCPRCKHRKVVYLAALIEKYGPDALLIDLRPRFRCSSCRMGSPNLHESAR